MYTYDVVSFFSRSPWYVCFGTGSDVGGFLLIYLLLLFMVHVFVCVCPLFILSLFFCYSFSFLALHWHSLDSARYFMNDCASNIFCTMCCAYANLCVYFDIHINYNSIKNELYSQLARSFKIYLSHSGQKFKPIALNETLGK